jgi:hypothetical protein
MDGKRHGYAHSCGLGEYTCLIYNPKPLIIPPDSARAAIARHHSPRPPPPLPPLPPLEAKDVVICSGGSGAIEICIAAVADPGDNVRWGPPPVYLCNDL